jgi:hypothetical protein
LLDLVEGELRAGTDIDPARTVEPRLIRGNTAFLDGRFAESVRLLDDDGESREKSAEWWLAQALRYAGQGERSEAMLGELLASPYRVPATRARATLASFLAARGMKAQAIGLLSGIRPDTYMDHHVAYAMGVAHAQLGDLSSARDWLGEASATGFPCYSWYERDPLLEPLRGDPEFDQFMAALRRSWEAARVRYGRSAGREG